MKFGVRVYKWIIISVALQLLLLLTVEHLIVNRQLRLVINNDVQVDTFTTENSFKIPDIARNIKVSHDGRYMCYVNKERVEVVSLEKTDIFDDFNHSIDEVSYFRWMPDRNILIYSVKTIKGNSASLQINTFDVESGAKKSYPKIFSLELDCYIDQLELSHLTNMVYAKVIDRKDRARIYSFNIMGHVKYITNVPFKTRIKEAVFKDILIYEDDKNTVYVRDGAKGRINKVNISSKVKLLGIDEEDHVFIGEITETGLLHTIKYSKLDTDDTKKLKWEEISLEDQLNPQDVIITESGEILFNEIRTNEIINIKNGEKSTYEGLLVEIVKDYIISKDGGKLYLKKI